MHQSVPYNWILDLSAYKYSISIGIGVGGIFWHWHCLNSYIYSLQSSCDQNVFIIRIQSTMNLKPLDCIPPTILGKNALGLGYYNKVTAAIV